MPIIVVVGIVAAYSGVGLYMRKKFFPHEPVQIALAWPFALRVGKK